MSEQRKDEQKRLRKEIGVVLKSWFEAHSITQIKVANDLGTSPAYVSGLCSGSKPIGKGMAKKLHDLYGISESFLLTGKGLIDDQIVSQTIPEEIEKYEIFQQAIQKSNRMVKAINHLIDEGKIGSMMDLAPVLGVLPSVLCQIIKYDPDGKYDSVIVRLVNHYPQLSLKWLLTGEGDMIDTPMSITEDIIVIKKELAQAREEFREATYRLTEFMRNILENSNRSANMVADVSPDNNPDKPSMA